MRANEQLLAAAGLDTDLESALFEADHGDPARAVELAEAAYAARHTVFTADALGWALTRSGRAAEAVPFVEESLRLGTSSAALRVHAAAAFAAAGQPVEADRPAARRLRAVPVARTTPANDGRRPRGRPRAAVPELGRPRRASFGPPSRRASFGQVVMRRLLLATAVAGLAVVGPAALASAHPLGNVAVNTYAGVVLGTDHATVDYVLDLAELPTVQARQGIDTDGDDVVSDAEAGAYQARECASLRDGLTLAVDDRPLPLDVAATTLTFPPGQAGLLTLRLECSLRAAAGAGLDGEAG